jgi:hypothetical protein
MKKTILIILLLAFNSLSSQKKAGDYKLDSTSERVALIRDFWGANRKQSYLSVLPFTTSIKKRRIPTLQGEGKGDFQLLEAFINLSYPLFYGNKSYNKMISLEYTANFRMTLDDSKPLTPGSNHIGLSLYKILNHNYGVNHRGVNVLNFYSTRIQLKHYSNGQNPGFYYFDPNNNNNYRNSYLSGDFSTNYLWLEITKGTYNSIGSLHQITGGYRYDLGTNESTFAYTKEQENSYGRHRLNFSYDYRTERFGKKYEHHFRIDSDYIIGNLSKFNSNLLNDSKKYRFSFKGMYEFAPKNHYSVGYFVSAYYGRDYLNIRYDDIIFSLQAGITLSLDKLIL